MILGRDVMLRYPRTDSKQHQFINFLPVTI